MKEREREREREGGMEGENGCTASTCNRLVDNIGDSSLCLRNDGRITRLPDVSTHKATAIYRAFSFFS